MVLWVERGARGGARLLGRGTVAGWSKMPGAGALCCGRGTVPGAEQKQEPHLEVVVT